MTLTPFITSHPDGHSSRRRCLSVRGLYLRPHPNRDTLDQTLCRLRLLLAPRSHRARPGGAAVRRSTTTSSNLRGSVTPWTAPSTMAVSCGMRDGRTTTVRVTVSPPEDALPPRPERSARADLVKRVCQQCPRRGISGEIHRICVLYLDIIFTTSLLFRRDVVNFVLL
jgi:hypothetical protein